MSRRKSPNRLTPTEVSRIASPRPEHDPRRLVEEVAPVADHHAPGRRRRLHAEAEEAQRRLGDDHQGDVEAWRDTMIAGSTLGRTWPRTMRQVGTPIERAASTYSSGRIFIASPRTTRAKFDPQRHGQRHDQVDEAGPEHRHEHQRQQQERESELEFDQAHDHWRRARRRNSRRPRRAANRSSSRGDHNDRDGIETRAPSSTRLKMSRPRSSPPSRCAASPPSSQRRRQETPRHRPAGVGSCGASQGAERRRRWRAREERSRSSPSDCAAAPPPGERSAPDFDLDAASAMAHARIDHAVEQIDDRG